MCLSSTGRKLLVAYIETGTNICPSWNIIILQERLFLVTWTLLCDLLLINSFSSIYPLFIYLSNLSIFQVYFISDYNKWKVLWISRTSLNQKLVTPTIQCLECIGIGYIIYQYATICSSIECYSKTLKSFLTSCVPNLEEERRDRRE